jgi:hypothetical protein
MACILQGRVELGQPWLPGRQLVSVEQQLVLLRQLACTVDIETGLCGWSVAGNDC